MDKNFNKQVVLSTGQFENEKLYWLEKLSGDMEKCNFPYDTLVNNCDYSKSKINFQISGDLYNKLNKISKDSDQNIFLILLTGIKALLYRYTGIDDIIIGTSIAKQGENQKLLNTALAIRSQIDREITFKNLLLRVREEVQEANNYPNYPIEVIMKELNINISNNMQSPIQTAVLLENMHKREYIDCLNASTVFAFNKINNSIQCEIEYNTTLYNKETIEHIASNYINLMESVLGNINICICDIQILSEQEKNQLLYDFNQTQMAYPKNMTIHKLFEEQVEKTPDNIAVVYNDKSLTYKQLNTKANQLARVLRAKGITKETIVSILVDKSLEMFMGILAVLKAGGAYLPIDPDYPTDRIEYMLSDSDTSMLLTQVHLKNRTSFSGEIILLDDNSIYTGCEDNLECICCSNNLAYIIYTSGSTGKPKGVMVEHCSLINLCEWHKTYYKISQSDRSTKYASFGFDASVWEIFPYITAGASIYVIDDSIRLNVEKLNEYYEKNNITISFLPTQLCEQFMKTDNKSLKSLLAGGDKLRYFKETGYKIINNYGPTENTVVTTSFIIDKAYDNIPIGKPIYNNKLYVLDKKLSLQPIGASGELYIAGDGLARGYLNLEQLTKETFIQSPFNSDERLYKTGDLVRWLPDGNIEFLGRVDSQVKIRGFRIELGEIENQLLECPYVMNAAVVDWEGNNSSKYLCAYVVPQENMDVDAIKEYLSKSLPEYMIPSYFIQMEMIPLTPNGKINRKQLPKPNETNFAAVQYEAPRNDFEQNLVEIWKEVLGVETIGINDNFFSLGGHSLKAANVISNIYKRLELEIPISLFFENPTIKGISQNIEGTKNSKFNEIKVVKEYKYLSSAQKRMYALQQLDQDGTGYNMPIIMTIQGLVEYDKLEWVFNTLIQRHESLRTSFDMEEGEQVQLIHENIDFKLEYLSQQSNDIAQTIKNFIRPFNLNTAPLLRAGLLKLSETEHIFILDMHHIISDGISMSILINEVTKLYEGESLPELKLQYKDYAAWQNEVICTKIMKEQEAYWSDIFSTEIPVLNLPTDFQRPIMQSFEGDCINFQINSHLTTKIKDIALKSGATLYMTFLAAYNVLLSKYSGQEDIVVGSPIAGRPHADMQNIIGMFVSTLAIRNYPEGQKTFNTFLNEVKTNSLKAFENQNYQFEELVEKLNITRDLSRNPLFDVMFAMQNLEMKEINIKGLTFKPYNIENKISKFDMTLTAFESDNNIILSLEYCTKLFKKETIEQMGKHFINILESIAENPDKKIMNIDILSLEEKNEILLGFNDTKVEYQMEKTIHQLFEEQVEKSPDDLAVVYQGKNLTYRELNHKANRLAIVLREKGVRANVIVGLMVERSLEMIIGIMGILKAGGAYLPLDHEYPKDRIKYMLEDSEVEILLTLSSMGNEQWTKDNCNSVKIINLDDDNLYSEDKLKLNLFNLETVSTPNSLAYIIYTSGSTGMPKGVMIEHKSVVNLCQWLNRTYNLKEVKNIIQMTNITFDVSVEEIIGTLVSGSTLYIATKEDIIDSKKFISFIKKHNINMAQFVPVTLEQLLTEDEKLECLKVLICGGDRLSNVLREKILLKGYNLYNNYGPTEITVDAISTKCDMEKDVIGKPIHNVQAYIVDKYNNIQAIGVPGELCIAGAGLARGYLNRADLTEEKFEQNPFVSSIEAGASERMYRTGDLVRWQRDGNIEFLGRIDHQVKIRGFRIELGEIENKLLSHKDIKEVVVIAKDDNSNNKYICAYTISEKELTVEELREFLAKELPEYMIPSYFIQLEKLPLNNSGKVNYKELPEPDGNILTGSIYEAPRNNTEQKLVELWRQVLSVDTIGINDSFFSLGGHSLKVVNLVAKIKDTYHINIPMSQIFMTPTIKGIAEYINKYQNEKAYVEYENIVLLKKSETSNKNIFVIHDGTGEVSGYMDLINNMDSSYNYWGIITDRLKGYFPQNRTIEEMSTKYIEQIMKIQPEGTYNIIGWSLGGIIAYEMARQLESINKQIGYLGFIDTFVPKKKLLQMFTDGIGANKLSVATERKLIESLVKTKDFNKYILNTNEIKDIWEGFAKYLNQNQEAYYQFKKSLQNIAVAVPDFEQIQVEELLYILNLVRTLNNTANMYSPRTKIKTQITFYKAEESEVESPEDWNKYCIKSIHVKELAGNHFSIMKMPNVKELADNISNHLLNIKE